MIRAAIVAIAITATPATAESLYLHTGAWSSHFSSHNYNETHDLVALEYSSYMTGYFQNSYGEDSVFAAKRWSWDEGHWKAGISLGAVYGYRSCTKGWSHGERRLCPMISPSLTYTRYPVQPSVLVLGNAIAVSVRTDLNWIFGGAK